SYDSRFANFVSRTRRLPPDPTRKAPVWKTSHRITVGRTFRDECHTTYGETTPIVLKLTALAECWAPAHWFLSATPCTSSPANLAAFMRLTETRQWRADPCTRKNNYQLLQQLGKQFNTASAKENVTQIDAILDRLGAFFRAINFLKRTQESVWFGRTCLDLPEQIVHPIDCPLDATDRENIKQLRDTRLGDIHSAMHTVNRGALKVKLSSMTQAIRICAAFPGLLCHAKQQGKAITDIPTTVERMEAEDILPHPENSWLASQIDTVLRGSSRWVAVQRIIDGLGIESDTGQPRKIVILSQYPTVAVIVYLAICKHYPAHHPYLGLRNAADRSFWVDKFQELPTGASLIYKNEPARSPGIFVATTNTSSRGLTLTRAASLILMEVDWRSTNHTQAFGRIRRIGQTSPVVHDYIFQNTQEEEDQRAILKNMARQALEKTVNTYGQKGSPSGQQGEEDDGMMLDEALQA
ncbi:uncharacterized protein KD926_006349, partial [Aspergillus affinis]|uniref:uncharacterized protein n=1 Tax=Aspergillus affinis TaxID=1070780 RepID=UPI0022FE18F1